MSYFLFPTSSEPGPAPRGWQLTKPRALRLWLVALCTTLFVATWPARVDAANPPEDSQTEGSIQEGIALRRAGNDEAALALFLDLERRDPDSIRVLLQITAAAQATGRWMLAHQYLRKAAVHKNDPYYLRNRAAIKAIEDAVAQHVGQFRALGEPAGAEVRLNGDVVGSLPMVEPLSIEVGSYALEISKPGFYALRRQVAVAGGALTQEAIELKVIDTQATPGVDAPRANAEPRANRAASERERAWWKSRAVTWTLASVTVAAAATTGVAFGIRESKTVHWNDDERCLDRSSVGRTRDQVCGELRDSARLAERVGIAAGVATLVFGGATLAQWLASSSPDSTANANVRPLSGCSPGFGSVVCFGTF